MYFTTHIGHLRKRASYDMMDTFNKNTLGLRQTGGGKRYPYPPPYFSLWGRGQYCKSFAFSLLTLVFSFPLSGKYIIESTAADKTICRERFRITAFISCSFLSPFLSYYYLSFSLSLSIAYGFPFSLSSILYHLLFLLSFLLLILHFGSNLWIMFYSNYSTFEYFLGGVWKMFMLFYTEKIYFPHIPTYIN